MMIKNNVYIYEKDALYLDNYKIDYDFITLDLLQKVNNFLYDNCKYKLVHNDHHFNKYIPIIIVISKDGVILSACELLHNPETRLTEIYNVSVLLTQRQQGHAKELLKFLFIFQTYLQTDYWIAVALNNPMYSIATGIYTRAGFTDKIGLNSITPSGIVYPLGFMQFYKLWNVTT